MSNTHLFHFFLLILNLVISYSSPRPFSDGNETDYGILGWCEDSGQELRRQYLQGCVHLLLHEARVRHPARRVLPQVARNCGAGDSSPRNWFQKMMGGNIKFLPTLLTSKHLSVMTAQVISVKNSRSLSEQSLTNSTQIQIKQWPWMALPFTLYPPPL